MNQLDQTLSPGTTRPRRARGRAGSIIMGILIILVGAVIMLYPKLTDVQYLWAQWRLEVAAAAQTVAGGTGAAGVGGSHTDPGREQAGGIALPDGAVALLEIPAIDLRAYVVEGTGGSALAQGPGHYPGTPLPGEDGNAAIAGHRTMYGHPFHDLDRLEPGDTILTATSERAATYRVVEVMVVNPGQTEVVAHTGENLLTLTTCHPKGSAAQRLVVVAERTH